MRGTELGDAATSSGTEVEYAATASGTTASGTEVGYGQRQTFRSVPMHLRDADIPGDERAYERVSFVLHPSDPRRSVGDDRVGLR